MGAAPRRALASLAHPIAMPMPAMAATARTTAARRALVTSSPRTFATAAAGRPGRTVVEHRLRFGGGVLVAAALDDADAVLLQLVVKRACLDAQQPRRLGLHAAALVVGPLDQLPLEILQDLGQRHLAGRQRQRVVG